MANKMNNTCYFHISFVSLTLLLMVVSSLKGQVQFDSQPDIYLIDTSTLVVENDPFLQLVKQQQVENQITLLKNEENLVPVKNFTQKMASLYIGSEELTVFQQMLQNYVDMDHYMIESQATESKIDQLFLQLDKYDLLLVGWQPSKNMDPSFLDWISEKLSQPEKLILSLFAPPEMCQDNQVDPNCLIMAYAPDSLHQSLTAQGIMGGIGFQGQLTSTLGKFRKGDGLKSSGGIRFKYTIPEEVNINSAYLKHKIDSTMALAIREEGTPGAQILVAKDGKVIFRKNYGYHTYDSLLKVEDENLYDLASVTKISASLPALMKLDDQGLFNPDRTIGTYHPYFKRSNKKNITFRDALAHQGRLIAWIPFWKSAIRKNGKYKWYTFKTDSSRRFPLKVADNLYLHRKYRKKLFKAIKKSPLREESDYVYSDLSFYLYPDVVECITAVDFVHYLNQNFFKPLGASSLTYNPFQKYPLEQVVPSQYDSAFRQDLLHGRVNDEGAALLEGISGHAGLFGNANDLAKLMQMYLNGGHYGDQRYLSQEILQEYSRCQYCEKENRRGMGFDKPMLKRTVDGNTAMDVSAESYGHSGFTGTFTWVDPEYNLLYVFLANRTYPSRDHRQLYRLNIRTNIQQFVYDAILNNQEYRKFHQDYEMR